MRTVTIDFVKNSYPKRHQWDRKGDHGRVLVIGGSRRYKGAPALCGMAALRAGADLATIASPESAADVISSFSPNLIVEPLVGDYIDHGDIETLLAMSAKADSVVIGNGLGRMKRTAEAVAEFLGIVEKPCVVDADALHMAAHETGMLKPGWIITPHAGEFFNLSHVKASTSLETRVKQAVKFSREVKAVVLLKGYKDIIAERGKAVINSTGNPYMTVGGTGDVLAGICGAFLAMGMQAGTAAACAAYVSGAAGDIAAKDLGPGMLPTDVIDRMPEVLKKVA